VHHEISAHFVYPETGRQRHNPESDDANRERQDQEKIEARREAPRKDLSIVRDADHMCLAHA